MFKSIMKFLRNTVDVIVTFLGGKNRFKKRMRHDTSPGVALTVQCGNILEEKIVIFSDLHRGDGGDKDHFKNNIAIYIKALNYYSDNDFTLVLDGDVEECWGYKIDDIMRYYLDNGVIDAEKKFNGNKKLYRVYGNHDGFWKDNMDKLSQYLEELAAYPCIIFESKDRKNQLLVIHGCQGHALHDIGDKIAETFVKINYGDYYDPSIYTGKELVYNSELRMQEMYLLEWALEHKMVVIGGHSHLPFFASIPGSIYGAGINKDQIEKYLTFIHENHREVFRKKYEPLLKNPLPLYFNCGCCIRKDKISAVQIREGIISQVEWNDANQKQPDILNSLSLAEIFQLISH